MINTRNWGPISLATRPTVTEAAAVQKIASYLAPLASNGAWRAHQLVIVPMANDPAGPVRPVRSLARRFRSFLAKGDRLECAPRRSEAPYE